MSAVNPKPKTTLTNNLNHGEFVSPRKPLLQGTLAHALDLHGEFSLQTAEGYALLDYPPCWHLAEFRSNRLTRFLPLTRNNLRLAFGKEQGDRWLETIRVRRGALR